MADKSDLKFYLTSAEPNLLQVNPSQSIGGYPSSTEYSVAALLSDPMDRDTEALTVDGALQSPDYAVIGEEVMKVGSTTDLDGEYGAMETLTVERGGAGTTKRFHAAGDIVYAADKNAFFNGSLSTAGKQYRCIAVRNMSEVDTFYDMKFYVKNASRNAKSTVKIAVEVPTDDILYGAATSGTTISLTDSSLIDEYPDNHFLGRLLVIDDPDSLNVNTARIIASFDSRTGVFTFRNSMAYSIAANTTYRIEQSNSQRTISGRIAPQQDDLDTSVITEFSTAVGLANAISIDEAEVRTNGVDLKPFETVYLWLERDISSNTDRYDENRVVFTAVYKNS